MKKRVTTITATANATADLPEMIVSTADLDRDSDRLFPEGADLTAFRKNPVLLWGHDYRELPIGKIQRINTEPGRGLRAEWTWLEQDDRADRVRNAWNQGVVRAASVGFIPKQQVPNEYGGTDVTGWELLEVSLVAIPANPYATRVLKNLGLLEDPGKGLFLELREEEKMMLDVDKNLVRTAVEKAIREALRPKHSDKRWDTPAWRIYREHRRIIEQSNRRSKRAQVEGYRRLQAWAEEAIKRSSDLACCPLLPPPR